MRTNGPSNLDLTLDVAGFVLGIGLALVLGWRTTDLVWGLWLSSLVVGFASLLVAITTAKLGSVSHAKAPFVKVFFVAFFAVHFGGFHFVHSVFLNLFFPVCPEGNASFGPGWNGYAEVFTRYWPWLCAAAIAERRHLLPAPVAARAPVEPASPMVTGAGEAWRQLGFNPLGPYRNVVRMHLLIFFFAGTFALGIDNIVVYAIVYSIYFWPWRGASRPSATRD